ncbi:hypothetical protein [Ornithinimicrobium cryptoxanthini]|uniref:hypothetical protein n=1 Tax=Ornithinimicrobium cryptoxanthini TaxID=2934161 RepID=UPI0021198274|nr:hypothetical protein [Ornithinimicrobium cryptoxanthini]
MAESARRALELSAMIGAAPTNPIETEIKRLEDETKLLKAKQAQTEAFGAAAASLVKGTSGAPEGTLTLDDTAGALAPWVARRELGHAIASIAGEVKDALTRVGALPGADNPPNPSRTVADGEQAKVSGPAGASHGPGTGRPGVHPSPVRVLVTDDPALFTGDWEAQLLGRRLLAHCHDLMILTEGVAAAARDVDDAVRSWVDADETTQDKRVQLSSLAVAGRSLLTAAAAERPAVAGGDDTPESKGDAGSAAAGSAESPLALALQLVALTRTDTTVTGRTVTAGDRELVIGVAAALAGRLGSAGTVLADGMTTVATNSPLLVAMARRAELRAALAEELAQLGGHLAVAKAAAAILAGTPAKEEEEGADEPDGKGDADNPGEEEAEEPDGKGDADNPADVKDSARPAKTPAPSETLSPADAKLMRALTEASLEHLPLFTQVSERVLALDAEIAGWLSTPASGGPSAMLAAAARERLHSSTAGYTHVLLLQNDSLTADVVTRKSLAGSSGRLTHLGSASASWLLVETDQGATVGGGRSSSAGHLVLDVASGSTFGSSIDLQAMEAGELPDDPYVKFQGAVKFFLVAVALALLIIAGTAMGNLIRGILTSEPGAARVSASQFADGDELGHVMMPGCPA